MPCWRSSSTAATVLATAGTQSGVSAPPGFEHPLQAQPQQNTAFREPLNGDPSGQPGSGLRGMPGQPVLRTGMGARVEKPLSAGAAKAKLQGKLAAHQKVGPVM